MTKKTITVAYGDGIGPEIMKATLKILEAAGAELEIEEIEVGEKVYKSGFSSGIKPEAWDSLRENKVLLKAPITTPQGGGYKSLNVTIRKSMGLFANVRPCVSYHPFIKTNHPQMDVVIIRENEEDLYAGIEHRQTDEVVQCLKLITKPGSEKIIRYAFEYAKSYGRKKVTAMIKDNIMKLSDGMFHNIFKEIAKEYPDIESDHMIIDIGMAKVANNPSQFDVIVTPNLYGDILSDIAAEITGSVGLAGSCNIGENIAMFEAIHGSAPDIAGKGIANPSGLLLSSIQMLVHIGQKDIAEKIHNAWMVTIEQGIHTGDIYRDDLSQKKVGTQEFADAVIANLGQKPHTLKTAEYKSLPKIFKYVRKAPDSKALKGVDVFVDDLKCTPDSLAKTLQTCEGEPFFLQVITNRGVKVWPEGFAETFCTDHWRCRFLGKDNADVSHKDVIGLLSRLDDAGVDFIKTEQLYEFNGERGYSAAQGT